MSPRDLILLGSLVCAAVASAIAVDIIDLGDNHTVELRYAVGWLAGAFVLFVLTSLVDGKRWFDR